MPKSKKRKGTGPKGPTPPSNKVTKKQANKERLGNQVSMLQGTVMNLRQMYDQAVIEKQALQAQIAQRDQLLTALCVEYGGKLETNEVIFRTTPQEYAGYELTREDDLIVIEAIEHRA